VCTPRAGPPRPTSFFARWPGESRRYDKVAEAFGAHGEWVRHADEMESALDRCFAAREAGRSAVLVASVAKI